MTKPRKTRGVVFDLGGVVLDSPLESMRRFESARGIEPGSITALVARNGNGSAWKALETGVLDIDSFVPRFERELSAAGIDISVIELMRLIDQESRPRPVMLAAIDRLRRAGLVTLALTNNWRPFRAADSPELRDRFDLFVESWVEGVNKPDPAIYHRLLERTDVPAQELVYLDDIGRNLKPARALGMTTIKVTDPVAALVELGAVLGIELV